MTVDRSTIPTEPEDFDIGAVKRELEKLREILGRLKLYLGREFRDLPEQMRAEIKALSVAPPMTSAGLEPVERVYWQLGVASNLLTKIVRGDSIRGDVDGILKTWPEPKQSMRKVESRNQEEEKLEMRGQKVEVGSQTPVLPLEPAPSAEETLLVRAPEPSVTPSVPPPPPPPPVTEPTGKPDSEATLSLGS